MDHSFSLQFNPINNVKTIKQYESELECLKTENFDLKHQLAQYKTNLREPELRQLLVDAQRSIQFLETERDQLQQRLSQERSEARAVSEQLEELRRVNAGLEDRQGMLETENAKLLQYVEQQNGQINQLSNDNRNMCEYLDRQKQGLGEQKTLFENMHSENQRLRKEIEDLIREKEEIIRNNEGFLKEKENLISRINALIEERNKLLNEKTKREEENKKAWENRNKEYNRIINNKEENIKALQKLLEEKESRSPNIEILERELKNAKDMNYTKEKDLERLIRIRNEDLNNIRRYVNMIENESNIIYKKVGLFKDKTQISKENRLLLRRLNIQGSNVNELIKGFNKIYSELVDKIRVMEKEIGEITYFAENNKNVIHSKTMKMLDGFTVEFNKARRELEECKRYLIKKGRENKELKNNLGTLKDKIKFLERKVEENKYETEKYRMRYNDISGELKKKQELINQMKLRINY
ncbi:hypothetical protein TCON_2256 [Astathelohania contejeani]|uniref:Uncharacterized protein n=1 Tax=Astathelohania contejeani TaxID=164912 RepID=A0ABQ7HWI9_9MICR|nr:hypothetical protein TCON_2256 [Thelohania contejeani]